MFLSSPSFKGFQWDPQKRRANLKKHNIDFQDAATIFDDPVVVIPSNHEEEARHIAYGTLNTIIIAVVFTIRNDHCRIISARRARTNERKKYCDLHPGGFE